MWGRRVVAALAAGGCVAAGAAHASDGSRGSVLRGKAPERRELRIDAPSRVVVRARPNRCAGARRISVAIDGGPARTLALRRGAHRYRLARRLEPGTHVVSLRLTDPRRRRCRASVRLGAPRVVPARPPRALAPAPPVRGVPLGTALSWDHVQDDPAYAAAALATFATFTPENELKMERLEPKRAEYDFGVADAMVDFALAHGKQVRGHALVYGPQTPAWVGQMLFPQDVDGALGSYIATVLEHFRGRIGEWDVVNEALDAAGHFRHNVFYDRLGPSYVERAFRYARANDPGVELFYNEYDAERPGPKRDATLALVRRLHEQGLIDGVGMQMHTTLNSALSQAQLEETMRLYEQLGLKVQITEMDVAAGRQDALGAHLAAQAQVFGAAARACADVAACERFGVWGVTDRYSWRGADAIPLLLDSDYRPKPALAAVRDVIGG